MVMGHGRAAVFTSVNTSAATYKQLQTSKDRISGRWLAPDWGSKIQVFKE